ncbi:MAG: VCBS repeat-containing protein, partial [Chloroflexota bacterium]
STIGIRTVTPPVFLYDHFTPFCLPVTPHRKTQGISKDGVLISQVYNNKAGTFTDIQAGLIGLEDTSAAWGDYDGDGDLDIFLSGLDENETAQSMVYRNDSTDDEDIFTDIAVDLIGLASGSADWVDYDADGDLDLFLTGRDGPESAVTVLYNNDGADTFSDSGLLFSPVWASDADWADYDQDGDLDLLLMGQDGKRVPTTMVYRNEGDGTFTELDLGLDQLRIGIAIWGDYDGDSDLDILVSGTPDDPPAVTYIYRNDGDDVFTNIDDAALIGVILGRGAWADYDLDGDLDVILTGGSQEGYYVSNLYRNDGVEGYNPVEANFDQLIASVAWGDYDGDGDDDLILSGSGGENDYTTKIYRNDVGRMFSETAVELNPVWFGKFDWGDFDADGDLDILMAGQNNNERLETRIYRQDGSGQFTDIGANLPPIAGGSMIWGDYDGDDDLDILLTGSAGRQAFTGLFENDGSGEFVLLETDLMQVHSSAAAWGDYDADGDLDILLAGDTGNNNTFSKIYRNDGQGVFIDIGAGLTGVFLPSVAWGDYDADGDLDAAITGLTNEGDYLTQVIRNDGTDTFVDIEANIAAVALGSISWADYDNDADLDLLVTGNNGVQGTTTLYQNDGDDTFIDAEVNLLDLSSSQASWGDYDRDGDLDILLVGANKQSQVARVYRNDRAAGFHPIKANLPGVELGHAAWGDYDNDERLDILLIGYDGNAAIAKLYHNNHSVALRDTGVDLTGLSSSNGAWGDYDNDGDLDLAIIGQDDETTYHTQIYRNDGHKRFVNIEAELTGVWEGSLAWGDYDNDSDLDLLVTGFETVTPSTKLYQNNGDDQFFEVETNLIPVSMGSLAWDDYDDDGDLDVVMIGLNEAVEAQTKLYRNDGDGELVDTGLPIAGVWWGDVIWEDYDLDGDLDLVFAGVNDDIRVASIFQNNNNTYTNINADLIGVTAASLAWGDYDNDGDLDLLLAGTDDDKAPVLKIYRQDDPETFVDVGIDFEALSQSSASWADYDNDGDLDILLSGQDDTDTKITLLYDNDGFGQFTVRDFGLENVYAGNNIWGDYDNDGDLDLFITGGTNTGASVSLIYENHETDIPATPTNYQLILWQLSRAVAVAAVSYPLEMDDLAQENVTAYLGYQQALGVTIPDIYDAVPSQEFGDSIVFLRESESTLMAFAEGQYGPAEPGLVKLAVYATLARVLYDPDSDTANTLYDNIEAGATTANLPDSLYAPVLAGLLDRVPDREMAVLIDTMLGDIETYLETVPTTSVNVSEASSQATSNETDTEINDLVILWRLTSKLSLSAIVWSEGSSAETIADTMEEVELFADYLGVALPPLFEQTGDTPADNAAAVNYLLNEAGDVLSTFASETYGTEAAQMVTLAIKSRLAVLLYVQPDSGGLESGSMNEAIYRGVADAGERSGLPVAVYQPFLDAVEAGEEWKAVRDLVFDMDEVVVTFLLNE